MRMSNFKSIVLTGGPCSGKSEGIEIIRQNLNNLGYKVIIIPEIATEIRQNGFVHTNDTITKVDFQRAIFKLQLFKENLYKSIIQKNDIRNQFILLLDRGLMDAKVYLNNEEFNKLIMEYNMTENDIFNRYDVVYHLESAANSKNNIYNNLGNKYRLSTQEQALEQEKKSIMVWGKHHNFHIIGVEDVFEHKIKKLEMSIINEVNK